MKRNAEYCKYVRVLVSAASKLINLITRTQKAQPSAGQRPLQLPARVRSTQKSSPKSFSTRATAAAAQI